MVPTLPGHAFSAANRAAAIAYGGPDARRPIS